jgi:hypothetical protein
MPEWTIWNIFFASTFSKGDFSACCLNIFWEGGFLVTPLCKKRTFAIYHYTYRNPTSHRKFRSIYIQYTLFVFNIRLTSHSTPFATSFWNTLKWFQVFYHSVFSLLLSTVCKIAKFISPLHGDVWSWRIKAYICRSKWMMVFIKDWKCIIEKGGKFNFLVRYR